MATKPTPFVPKFIKSSQIQQESGGKQFDSSGKPLLGRYRDGSAPKPSERSYGIGQIQIGTARETARKHGIPWDENKLLNDSNYNLQLADLHKGDLLQRYKGDETLAIAAYHSGSGNVDRAVSQHGRAGFTKGLGPEGRNYVRKLTGEGSGAGSSAISSRTVVGRNPLMAQGKVVNQSEATVNPVVNPFKVSGEAVKRSAAVEEDLAASESMVQDHGAKLKFIQNARRDRTEHVVAEKRVLLDSLQAENRQLAAASNPFLQRQVALGERLGELATMNPLEKGLKGIFNLNYNEKYLAGVAKETDQALELISSQHSANLAQSEQYLKLLDAEEGNESELENLTLKDMDQNSALMAQNLNASKMAFAFIGEQVNANENLIRAQVLSTANFLDGQDAESTQGLLAEAMKSPDGTIQKAGVILRVGELKDRVMKWEQQNLSMESSIMAMENNRQELAVKHSADWAKNASAGELRAAAAVNGNYRGMKIPMDVIMNQIGEREQFNNYQVQRAMGGNDMANLAQMSGAVGKQLVSSVEKWNQMGLLSRNDPATIAVSAKMKNLAALQMKLQAEGRGAEAAPALMKEYQALSQEISAMTAARAKRLSGGNPKSEAMLNSYMSGQNLSRAEAIDGMVGFVEDGGLPSAMSSSNTFKGAYAATAKAAAQVAALEEKAGKKFTKDARAARIREIAGPMLAQEITRTNMKDFHAAIPEVARRQGHPAGQIPVKVWQQAVQISDATALENLGKDFGITGTDVQGILSGNWAGAGKTKEEREETIRAIRGKQQSGELAAAQNALLLRFLDEGPAAKPGFKPSDAIVDYTTSSKFVEAATRYERAKMDSGFADFVAASAGDKGMVPKVIGYGAGLQAVKHAADASDLRGSWKQRNAFFAQPYVATEMVLKSNPSIRPEERTMLLAAVRRRFPEVNDRGAAPEVNAKIRQFIVGGKFEQPELERVRKLAAKDWDASARTLSRALNQADFDAAANPITGENLRAAGNVLLQLPGMAARIGAGDK